jgi:hypothetical protein
MKTLVIGSTMLFLAGILAVANPTTDELPSEVTVHEWGTFTSVAGARGLAVDWAPTGGPVDLPCFVDSVSSRLKRFFISRVRMETPVIYFYAPREARVDVRVDFPSGSITEWYPARDSEPGPLANLQSIRWRDVRIQPGESGQFPMEDRPSHYYAARRTAAASIEVGEETEKFLFYRGTGDFQPPIAATVRPDGRIHVRNLGAAPIRGLVVFENRAGRIAYRVAGDLGAEALLEGPSATDPEALGEDMVAILTGEVLFEDEARAMVETWRDSWFEEGTRLFYIEPTDRVDAILPLRIDPAPARLVRTFVGRLELATPGALADLEASIRAGDSTVPRKLGRFLEPILGHLIAAGRLTAAEQQWAKRLAGELAGEYRAADPCL